MRMSRRVSIRALLTSVLIVATAAAGEGDKASTSPPSLTVHVKVVRVNVTKVKNLGFDWVRMVPGGTETVSADRMPSFLSAMESGQFTGLLESLRQNSLAQTLAEPTITTLSGRPASLKVGGTQLDVVPIVLEDGRVRLDYRLECEYEDENTQADVQAPRSRAQVTVDSAAILPADKTTMLIHAPSKHPTSGTEYHTIVFVKVERTGG